MHPYRDRALVLRTYDLGEADRILTMLCHEHGLVRGVARGVRRTRSKFGSRLEPFTVVDASIVPSRRGAEGLAIVRSADTVETFAAEITGDWPSYAAACAMMETAEHLATDEPRILRMLVLAFRSLAAGRRAPSLVADSFMLRALQASGWEPVLLACARCGVVGPHRAYHVPSGGAVCVHCRPAGALTPRQGTPEVLDGLLHGRWDVVESAPEQVRRQASQLVAAHLQWHTERKLRTLPLLESGPAGSEGKDHTHGTPA